MFVAGFPRFEAFTQVKNNETKRRADDTRPFKTDRKTKTRVSQSPGRTRSRRG